MKSLHQREGITGSDALKKEVGRWREKVRLWRKEEWWEGYEVWQQHEDSGPAQLIHEDLRWRQSVYKLPILIQWKEKNWTWQIVAGCNSDLFPDRRMDRQTNGPLSLHSSLLHLWPWQSAGSWTRSPPHGFSIVSWWCSGELGCLAVVWSYNSFMPNLSILAGIRSHPFLPPLPDVWEDLALSLRFQGDTAQILLHGSWPLFSNGECLSSILQPAWWLK